MTHEITGKLMNGRYILKATKAITFLPQAINVEERIAAGKPLQASEAAAAYATGQLANLPKKMADVVFECSLIPGPSGAQTILRPIQPNAILIQALKVPKGSVVKIE